MTLNTYTPNQSPYKVGLMISCTLHFLKYSPDNIPKVWVIMARTKVKSRSHHATAKIHPSINVLTKYNLLTPYVFRDIYSPDKSIPTAHLTDQTPKWLPKCLPSQTLCDSFHPIIYKPSMSKNMEILFNCDLLLLNGEIQ